MNDFLATLAAQALSLAPVIHPLVPARYAPMPSLGGVGTIEGLRAGGSVAAPSSESPLPSPDRFAAPPPLLAEGVDDTAYTPFSFLQLRQAGARQIAAVEPGIEPPALAAGEAATHGEVVAEVTSTEPELHADAGRSSVVTSSEPVYAATDVSSSPAQMAETVVASPLPLQQSAAAASPPSSANQPPIEDALSGRTASASTQLQPTATAPIATPQNQGNDPEAAKPVPASAVSQRPSAVPQSELTVEAAHASGSPPSAEGQPVALSLSPEPLTRQPAQASAARPETTAVQPALGSERSVPALDHAASPWAQVAISASPAEPAADAGSSPRPSATGAPQAAAGSRGQSQAMHTQPATEAITSWPQPEVVAPPSVASLSQAGPVAPPARGEVAKRVPPTLPDAAAPPSAVNQRSPVVSSPALPEEAAQGSGFAVVVEGQLPAFRQPPERLSRESTQSAAAWAETAAVQPAQAVAARLEIDAVQPARGTERSAPASNPFTSSRLDVAEAAMLAKPTLDDEPLPRPAPASATQTPVDTGDQPRALQTQSTLDAAPSAMHPEVVAAPPTWMAPQLKRAGLRSNGDAARSVASPAAAAAPAAIIQRAAVAQSQALPAVAGDFSGPVPRSTVQPSEVARPPETAAPPPAQTAAFRPQQVDEQSVPAAGVKPSALAPGAPGSLRLPRELADLIHVTADGLETSRGRSAGPITGEHALVRPVLPTANGAPAIQGNVGRNPSQSEAAPLPTIRVTIGRIEVRSSKPALSPPANLSSRPRPALSLDDYLKRGAKVRP